jgi:tight adherence protein B
MTAWLAAMLGAGVGFGVILIVVGWRTPPTPKTIRAASDGFWLLRAALTVTTGGLFGLLTGWPVGALAAGAGTWCLAGVLREGRGASRRQLARIEAVAAWAEQLRDVLATSKGLSESIAATAPVAPLPIRADVEVLARRLHHQRVEVALREWADGVDDPTGDLVASVLILAATRAARDVETLLTTLAELARERSSMRLRVDAKRAAARFEARALVVCSVGFLVGLAVFASSFLAPYDTAAGQAVLTVVVAIAAGSIWWLTRLARFTPAPRVLVVGGEDP